jgi:hypothetical protein
MQRIAEQVDGGNRDDEADRKGRERVHHRPSGGEGHRRRADNADRDGSIRCHVEIGAARIEVVRAVAAAAFEYIGMPMTTAAGTDHQASLPMIEAGNSSRAQPWTSAPAAKRAMIQYQTRPTISGTASSPARMRSGHVVVVSGRSAVPVWIFSIRGYSRDSSFSLPMTHPATMAMTRPKAR